MIPDYDVRITRVDRRTYTYRIQVGTEIEAGVGPRKYVMSCVTKFLAKHGGEEL
jgi:hypothetical protein